MQTKIVGITGGIGSGKSLVCEILRRLGYPIFDADREAKEIYSHRSDIAERVNALFGEKVIDGVEVNRKRMADLAFRNPVLLKELNGIVHPAVKENFIWWMSKQNSPIVIREAAIMIESGSNADCEFLILVTAPKDLKIKRLLQRGGMTIEQIEARMIQQWSDEEKRSFCDFEIVNDEVQPLLPQIDALVIQLRNL